MSDDTTLEVSPDTIVDIVKEGAEIYSTVTAGFVKEFVFYDKTLYEWATYLMIEVPKVKDLDAEAYRELLINLSLIHI